MAEVGKAYLTIIPSMEGSRKTIASDFNSMMSQAGGSASDAAGSSFMKGFSGKLAGMKGIISKALPVAAVAGAAGAAGKALFGIGAEFDDMTDSIIIGTGASGQALEGLKQSAMDMATTVPMSFADAGNIVQDLNTRLGLTGDTLTAVGTQIAQVGDMTGEAFDTEAFAGAMSAFGTSAEDMSGQLDTLFAVSQSTGIGMNELTGIVEGSAPTMQALGYSFEDTAAMAGLLDKAGLDASGTMSKMSKALTTMAKDGEDPAETLQRTTEEISGLIEKGDEAGAIDMASKLFGTKGAAQFVAAVQSGSMNIEEFANAMGNSEGIIGETQERTMDFAERVELLKNQFKQLLEPLGSAVFTGLSDAMAVISDAFGQFVDGPGQAMGETFRKIVAFGSKIGETFATAFKDASGIKSFGSAMSTVGSAVSRVGRFLRPVASVLGQLLRSVVPPLARALGGTLGAAFRTVGRVVQTVGRGFNSFKSTIASVREAFSSFKRTVTAPFRFLSGLKLPHVSVSGGKAPWGIGGMGTKPSFGVTWGAKGGILDHVQLIGAAEAGREALLPLDRNTGWMDDLADRVSGNGNWTVNMYAGAQESPEEFAQRTVRELQRMVRMGAV